MTTVVFKPSSEQEKVIAHRGGHLQVIACAGAGKTEAIARRVSSLIEEGFEPGQIVAFTFTERAVASLKTRITRLSAAYLHHLNSAQRRNVLIGDEKVKEAKERADVLIDGIVQGKFPAQPEASKCRGCDVRSICKHANFGNRDY